MDDGLILYVGEGSHSDGIQVSPENGTIPHTHLQSSSTDSHNFLTEFAHKTKISILQEA